MSEPDRRCSKCRRIYTEGDWQEENCPFCNEALIPLTGTAGLLTDTVSMHLVWPEGEKAVPVGAANGYLDAQLFKAALESENIPVLLQGETATQALGLWVGSLGSILILVPQSKAVQAKKIFDFTEK